MRIARGQALALVLLLGPLILSIPRAAQSDGTDGMDSAAPLLEAIGALESENDAKCHSTACRFEDSVSGTPLGQDGRLAKIELQKELVESIWREASTRARNSHEKTVDAQRVKEQIYLLLVPEQQADGQILVHYPGGPPVPIPVRRVEQYGSIGYSLRAILAVQQDSLFASGPPLLPLTEEAIDSLRLSLDLLTLSALMRADQAARERNQFEISPAALRSAWRSLVPQEFIALRSVHGPVPTDSTARSGRDPEGLAVLDHLIEKKVAAYRAYNNLSDREMDVLLFDNTARFYARTPVGRIFPALIDKLDRFSEAIVTAADATAAAGHTIIRADDATHATLELLPQEIDEFEDVHTFPGLAPAERITLDAADCDSFRDFGMHWESLKRALHNARTGTRLVDPFAAEILAETISQYGVLLLRLAGEHSKKEGKNVRLLPPDLDVGVAWIKDRTKRHRHLPPQRADQPKIASSRSQHVERDLAAPTTFFTDVTELSALDFTHHSSKWLGEFRQKQVNIHPTFSGGGIAAEDIDGDSHVDLLLVGGKGNALFMGRGDGRFVNISHEVEIDLRRPDGSLGEARNPIIADFDNDGQQDILITYVDDDHRLYRGMGGRNFKDVSAGAGLGGKGLVAGPAAVFDFDADGLLDIYIGYFGDYLKGALPDKGDDHTALPNRLFRNKGEMRFEDVSEASGTADTGWTQAVSAVDFARDGRQDIIVANDFGLNAFFRNLGGGRFENLAPSFGMTRPLHSMNVGVSDLNGDGYPDIYISNIATLIKDDKFFFPDVTTNLDFDLHAMAGMRIFESDVLYMSQQKDGQLSGYGRSKAIERGSSSTGWAWDAEFFDFDHDGDDDLYLVNGYTDYNLFSTTYNHVDDQGKSSQHLLNHGSQSNVFYVNENGQLKNLSTRSGADFVGNSRSTAYLDMDDDGDLDIAVNNLESPARILRNNTERGGLGWLKLRLIGDPSRGSNRDAIGARIVVTAPGGLAVTRFVQCGSGYLSMNPKQQHFGLVNAQLADVHITWPNGDEQSIRGLRANHAYRVRQGVGVCPKP